MPRSNATYNVPFGDAAGKPCLQGFLEIGFFRLLVTLFALKRIDRCFEHLTRAGIPPTSHQPLSQFIEPLRRSCNRSSSHGVTSSRA
jgi:hypothetical protein